MSAGLNPGKVPPEGTVPMNGWSMYPSPTELFAEHLIHGIALTTARYPEARKSYPNHNEVMAKGLAAERA